MASSGTLYSSYRKSSRLYLNWRIAKQDIANNKSLITWEAGIQVGGGNLWYTNAVKITGVYIGGGASLGSGTYSNLTSNGLYKKLSGSKWVSHDANGACNLSCQIYGYFFEEGDVSGSHRWSLTNIPRKATLTSIPNIDDENSFNIGYSNPAGSAVSSLYFRIEDGNNGVLASWGVPRNAGTSSVTLSPSEEEKTNLRKFCSDANSKTVLVTLRTELGGSMFWDTYYRTLTILNNKPTFSNVSAVNTNNTTSSLRGNDSSAIIKGVDTVTVKAGVSLKKSATLKSIDIKSAGFANSYTSTDATAIITEAIGDSVTVTATDSRGNQVAKIFNFKVYDYVKPSITIDVNTPTAAGTADITVKGNCYTGTFANNIRNNVKIELLYKEANGAYPTSWTNITPAYLSGKTFTATTKVSGLDYKKAYTFKARITDSINTVGVITDERTVKSTPLFDWGKNNFMFNVPALARAGYGAGADEESAMGSLTEVGGGKKSFTEANGTGYLRIILPAAFTDRTGVKFDVDVYSYSRTTAITYTIAGQLYNGTSGNNWYRSTVGVTSTDYTGALPNASVQFGEIDGKPAIAIGNADTNWGTCEVVIKNVHTFMNHYGSSRWADGWIIDISSLSPALSVTMATGKATDDRIVDSGSSGIWEYIKFRNGLAFCKIRWEGVDTPYTDLGANYLHRYGHYKSFSLPFPFVGTPIIATDGRVGNGLSYSLGNIDKTSCILYIFGNVANNNIIVSAIVMGKWR